MAQRHSIGMVLLDRGEPADQARDRLAAALAGATVTEPDAVAAAGADDHIAFLEHPSLPEHWRRRAQAPS